MGKVVGLIVKTKPVKNPDNNKDKGDKQETDNTKE